MKNLYETIFNDKELLNNIDTEIISKWAYNFGIKIMGLALPDDNDQYKRYRRSSAVFDKKSNTIKYLDFDKSVLYPKDKNFTLSELIIPELDVKSIEYLQLNTIENRKIFNNVDGWDNAVVNYIDITGPYKGVEKLNCYIKNLYINNIQDTELDYFYYKFPKNCDKISVQIHAVFGKTFDKFINVFYNIKNLSCKHFELITTSISDSDGIIADLFSKKMVINDKWADIIGEFISNNPKIKMLSFGDERKQYGVVYITRKNNGFECSLDKKNIH